MTAVRVMLRGFGELLITAGIVVLLFCVYQLFYTNLAANRAMDDVRNGLHQKWDGTAPRGKGASELPGFGRGEGFALIYIPRLGSDYVKPVLEGVSPGILDSGVGHYPETTMPGKLGNFSVAGHRATNGEPFAYLDGVRPGDRVVVETGTTWYTYIIDDPRMYADPDHVIQFNRGNIIVSPADVGVLSPVPYKPAKEPEESLITLTTCNPRWASYQRMIVFGHLESKQQKSDGPPAALRS
ncbi:MAG: class E sortase [Streptomycetales bacterium]